MKKLIILAICFAMICSFVLPAGAGSNDSTTINISLTDTADILVVNSTGGDVWDTTGGLGATLTSPTFTISNEGYVQVDVTINATDTAAWTLETAPEHNQFTLMQNQTGSWVDIPEDAAISFLSNFAWDGNETFEFQMELPTSSSTATGQQITVTFEATVD